MAEQAGEHAVVSVAVATLWSSPDAVRPVDTPALGNPCDVRSWVAGMGKAARDDLDDRSLTQLLLGEQVLVEEIRDGWAKIIAVEQPADDLDARGYPGWLPADQLGEPGDTGYELVVDATATALRDGPGGDVVLSGVILGTRLVVVGRAERGWVPVAVPGQPEPVWALEADVAPMPTAAPSPADVLTVAERLIDVPYIWGGLSPYGIDCSGLVHLAHRRLGTVLPRDAADQAAATKSVNADQARPGDLYFFARDDKPIHHVGFVAAEGEMIHACSEHQKVLSEPLAGHRAETLVATHRAVD